MTGLVVQPVLTELLYHVEFPEPIPDLFESAGTTALLQKLVKGFRIRLNDIKSNKESVSDAFLQFSLFEGQTWFNVRYGLEEITATMRAPKDEEQVIRLYSKLADCFKQYPMSRQRMNMQHQFKTDGDAGGYLKGLNPHAPGRLEAFTVGRGVFYTLDFKENNLKTHLSVAASLLVSGGIFVGIENEFNPNNYDFQAALEIVKRNREAILEDLGIVVEKTT